MAEGSPGPESSSGHEAASALQLYRSRRRAILPLDGSLHVPRSLRRVLHAGRFELRLNSAFEAVLAGCADRPSTWISGELAAVYRQLHCGGLAHSVEAFDAEGLAGGLLAIAIGACWIGESMFHRRPHASNVLLVGLVEALAAGGFLLFDVQLSNPHLERYGCRELADADYSRLLAAARSRPATLRLSEARLTSEAWMTESEWFK
ncbi:MAG: leucyl/phenylalanyl-tRNA--protein transferase [Synechococcaceae cyanobacterium]|nr:leucyl/phenylalanyl-tRNA--protein transferase [Synechococcaceae cyanobacterium]